MNTVSKNSFGKIYIEKKSPQEWLTFVILILPFAFGLLTQVFRLPDFIRFSLDVIVASLLAFLILNRYIIVKKETRPLLVCVVAFFVYVAIVYCFNFQSPFYFFWGTRNNFRFYIAFFIFATYVKEETATDWLKLLDVIFWINFAVSLIQFFFMDVRQDYLGGIFGIGGGTNGYTLLFFCIIISRALLMTFNGEGKAYESVLKIIASLLIAAMAEMKFYYVAFFIMLIITSALTKFSKRKFMLLLFSAAGIIVGATLLSFLFDEFDNFISLQSIWEVATKENYASGKDINRLSAIFTLSKDYVTSAPERLFGLGLGNCDTSSLSIFNSSFYQNYQFLHYTWFSLAMLFLETGIIGLVLYFSFFFICFGTCRKKMKENIGNQMFCQMAIVMSIMCCIISLYNSSLRIEAGYMAYFILALPFMSSTSQTTQPE